MASQVRDTVRPTIATRVARKALRAARLVTATLFFTGCGAPRSRSPGAAPCCHGLEGCIATLNDPRTPALAMACAVDEIVSTKAKTTDALGRLQELLAAELRAAPLRMPSDGVRAEKPP
jgi:hypothetical protein